MNVLKICLVASVFALSGCKTKFSLKNSILNCSGVRFEFGEDDMMIDKDYKLFKESDNELIVSDADDKTKNPVSFIFTKKDDTHVSLIKKSSGHVDDGTELLCTYQKK